MATPATVAIVIPAMTLVERPADGGEAVGVGRVLATGVEVGVERSNTFVGNESVLPGEGFEVHADFSADKTTACKLLIIQDR